MDAKELIRLPDPRKDVKIEVREIVRDIHNKPHVFIRVRLTGWNFPHRGLEPFLLVGRVLSKRVIVSTDGLTADAYFDNLLPEAKRISFGYGKIIQWDFNLPIRKKGFPRLDRKRLPVGVVDPFTH